MGFAAFLMVLLGGGETLPSQLFFPGKQKQTLNPEQVAQICQVLKGSGEETTRMAAVDDLRMVEGPAQIVAISALMETLKTDRKAGVRAEAAVALSKMRPVRQEVGTALENTITKDSSMRVRIQARSALLQYNLAGYRSAQGAPPVADPLGQIAKEPNTPAPPPKNNWNWMTNPFALGVPTHPEGAQPLASEPYKPWPRPGKAFVGWIQGMMGYPDTTANDKNLGLPTGSNAALVPMPQRLPAQINFPPVPEFSPTPKPSIVPNTRSEPIGPDLGSPRP